VAISFLIQQGLGNSVDFNAQVNAVVQQEALYKANNDPALDANQQYLLATVVRSPATYGFTTTMLADSAWSLTYDAWANDVAGAEGAIRASVGVWFEFLTGYVPTPSAPPEIEPTVTEGA
jgi:hypothetical protein